MSRFYGDFDPASTATTTIVTLSTATRGIVEAVAQNFFPFESTAANLASGDGVFTSVGAFSYSSAVGTPYGAGTALRVEGGAHMTITSAGAVQMMEFSSAFTFEFWAYRETGANSATSMQIFDSRNNNDNPNNCFLVSFNSGKLVVSPGASGGANQQIASTAGVLNAWQHYAIARDSSMQMRMFYDGVKKYDASYTVVSDNKATGGAPHFFETVNNTFPFTGYIRDLRIFKDVCIYTKAFPVTTQPLQATSNNIGISTSATTDTRSHSHVWNYSDVYDARFADSWPDLVYDTQIALYLPFNGSLTDFSSYGHTVSAVGDAAVTTSPFQFHGSCAFDGNGDLLTVPHNNIFDFGGNDFTIEGFINPTTAAGVQGVYSQWGGTGSRSFKVVISTNAKLEINGSNDGSTGTQINQIASTALELNTFSHFAVTREGSNFRIFINGVNRGTTTDSRNLYNSNANIAIGGNRADNTSSTLFGNLEDFRVINGLALYTTAFEVPTRSINNTLTVNP